MNLKLNKKILISALGFCLIVACGILYLNKNSVQNKNIIYSPRTLNDHISGLSENTQVKLSYLYSENIIEERKQEKNGFASFIINQEITDHDKYAVHYSLELDSSDYIDIELDIDKIKDQLTILISGLKPAEQASLIINKRHVFKDIPSDWTGKIEFTANAATSLEDQAICVRLGKKDQTICHLAPVETIKVEGA